MTDTRDEVETDQRELLTDEFCSMTPSEMRRIMGGRCLYGTEENGCLWLIPGTHKKGALKAHDGEGTLGALYTDVSLLEQKPAPMALSAGSVVWFHRDTVHGSRTNRSDSDRRLFLLAYQPAGLHQWRNGVQRDIQTAPSR